MAIFLVMGLRIPIRLKVFVVAAFAFRIPSVSAPYIPLIAIDLSFRAICFIILRLHYLHPALVSLDPTFNAVFESIWMEVEQHYSIIASTIPCLKPFMVACNTGWGHVPPQTGDATTALRSGGSYGLRSLDKSGIKNTVKSYNGSKDKEEQTLRGKSSTTPMHVDPQANHHQEQNGDETSQSIASNDSTQMIIRREVGWTVTYEDETPGETHGMPGHSHFGPRSDIEAHQNPHAV